MYFCSIQELATLDNELVYSEQRKDATWKQIIEYLEGNTQSEAQNLPKKYRLSEFQLHNGLLHRNAEITCKGVYRGKVKQLVISRELVPSVLNFNHDCATSSHPGKEKAYKQTQLKYVLLDRHEETNIQSYR